MSLSNVIKPFSALKGQKTLASGSEIDGERDSGFLSFDSLWKGDPENPDALSKLQKQKEKLRQEVKQMIADAQSRVKQIEKEAYEKGFAKGSEKAAQEEKKRTDLKILEFGELFTKIAQERKTLYQDYEHDVLDLVKVMVEKLVGHEVTVNPKVIQACLTKSLSYIVENSQVKVHLNSKDFNRIREAGLENPELLEGYSQLELVENPSMTEGGCFLETNFGEVDATLENRKERLFKAIEQFFSKALSTIS